MLTMKICRSSAHIVICLDIIWKPVSTVKKDAGVNGSSHARTENDMEQTTSITNNMGSNPPKPQQEENFRSKPNEDTANKSGLDPVNVIPDAHNKETLSSNPLASSINVSSTQVLDSSVSEASKESVEPMTTIVNTESEVTANNSNLCIDFRKKSFPPEKLLSDGETSSMEDDGFQTVTTRRSKEKSSLVQQMVCSIPSANNRRFNYKLALAKYVPVRGAVIPSGDKAKTKDKGIGGVPQNSSTGDK